MRVLLAGATGVIGRQAGLVLSAAGHDVIGLARTTRPVPGTQGVAADILDADATARAVQTAAPDVVVHLATAIPDPVNPRRLDYAYDPADGEVNDEDQPLWRNPPKQYAPAVIAIRDLEAQVLEAGGLAPRCGHLYGPGSAYAEEGGVTALIREGKMPIVGDGGAIFSFVHARDVATAILRRRRLRLLRCAQHREVLGWRPAHASWREGFAGELAPTQWAAAA